MKRPFLVSLLLSLALLVAAGIGWFAGRQQHSPAVASLSASSNTQRVRFYQSPMHPWIKSDQPGKCTICGMDLVPVYDAPDDRRAGAPTDPGTITLSAGSVRVAGVRAEPVRRGVLMKTLAVAGTVEDDETRHRYISAFSSGRVETLNIRYVGAEVQAGQPLATFYAPDVQIAEGELLSAMRSGAPDRGVGVNAAREKLRRLGLADAQIAAVEKRGTADREVEILAPIGGTVIERNVYEGQWVNYGDRMFTLADFSTMWFQFDAYERDLPWLKVGQPVEVTSDALPGQTLRAQINFIDPNFNDATRSTKVRVEIKHCPLPHRSFARGRVDITNKNAGEPPLLVPRTAVLQTGGERAVAYVELAPGQYAPRIVQLGRAGDADYEVLSGLREGDRVVTSGSFLIDAQAQLGREVAATEHVQ